MHQPGYFSSLAFQSHSISIGVNSRSLVPVWHHIKARLRLRTSLMISDVFSCGNEAEILARKEGGCIVRTAAAALCLPSSTGSGDRSGASEGGDACLSGSSILSGVLACIPAHPSLKIRQQSVLCSAHATITFLRIITYYYVLLRIFFRNLVSL